MIASKQLRHLHSLLEKMAERVAASMAGAVVDSAADAAGVDSVVDAAGVAGVGAAGGQIRQTRR